MYIIDTTERETEADINTERKSEIKKKEAKDTEEKKGENKEKKEERDRKNIDREIERNIDGRLQCQRSTAPSICRIFREHQYIALTILPFDVRAVPDNCTLSTELHGLHHG
ncbi:hypothetical protein C0Q70_00859 [Pomacea canaliculata]|uniref:Uncharacterized protein n=1 Tax=Pomacea canaliculata TaxID=400727 RepID=A0A2T7PXW7_POMCA|nr:hypothetical protein C0Q70_00859 [Pomacea canaliculata]